MTCNLKRPNLRLFRLKISQFVPFCMKTPKNPPKGDKLWNFKSKQPETRAFKGTCYKTKKALYYPTFFLSDQFLLNKLLYFKSYRQFLEASLNIQDVSACNWTMCASNRVHINWLWHYTYIYTLSVYHYVHNHLIVTLYVHYLSISMYTIIWSWHYIYTICLSLCTQSTHPNLVRGTHCSLRN